MTAGGGKTMKKNEEKFEESRLLIYFSSTCCSINDLTYLCEVIDFDFNKLAFHTRTFNLDRVLADVMKHFIFFL